MAIRLNPDGSIDFDTVEDLRAYQHANDALRVAVVSEDLVVPEAPVVSSVAIPVPERVDVPRYLPVTKREKTAIKIMRRSPDQQWTTDLVGSLVVDPKDRDTVRGGVSQMCRGGRGVIEGVDSTHYLLDEWGKHAELRLHGRPSRVWPRIKAAWEQGKDWANY